MLLNINISIRRQPEDPYSVVKLAVNQNENQAVIKLSQIDETDGRHATSY